MSADTFSYDNAEIPKRTGGGRPAEVNPHLDAVAGLKGTDRALTFTIPETDEDKNRAIRQLRAAGRAADVTVRTKVANGSDKTLLVTFWTTARVTRKPTEPETVNAETA